ncbi:MAG: DUF4390 domain-containing protein [Gemmatimonadetes bacterium]|nr:DUF4390 domain-containing protein [Gemmatimonadota bacterium]
MAADAAAGHRALLRLGPVLQDPGLQEAVRSGLPLRIRLRVELWRDGFVDDLAGTESWATLLLYEPLGGRYLLRTRASSAAAHTFASYDDARAALERIYPLTLRPQRGGRYYYTAVLDIETFSLSDLEELENWLKGELQPAVRGRRSFPSALGQGLKRLLIGILGLPGRRYEAKSEQFRVP